MNETGIRVELREVLAGLRRGWWLLVAGAVLGSLLGLAVSLASTPQYSSQIQFFVSTRDSATTSEAFQGSQLSQQRVTSYTRLLSGEELATRVVARLRLDMSPVDLAAKINATAAIDTVLLDVAVTDESPERAQAIAEVLGVEFIELVKELETPDGTSAALVQVTVTDEPDVAAKPTSPNTLRNVVLGLGLGLLLGIVAAIVRARFDRNIRDPDEAAAVARAPVIGTVIRDDALGARHVVDRLTPTRAAEDYRQLRTNLQFLSVDDPPKVIMVSSAMPAEGKTTAAINLALALAEAGRNVTLVDADLRRPRVTNYLGMVGGVGLTNILAGAAELADVLQPYGESGVQVIGAGPTPPNPSELLASRHMLQLVEELRGKSEYVLVDAPPLLPVADATGLAVVVDGVLLSVRYGHSRKDQLQQAAATLERVGARTLGLILNIVPHKSGITAAYGYGSTYAETSLQATPKGGRRRAP